MRENAQAKGRRYLLEGRLVVEHVDAREIRARCRGGGHVYALGFDGEDWTCTCPARTLCAHLVALQLVTHAKGHTDRDTPSRASPERTPGTDKQDRARTPHLLKNGHPAHVFTDEDRRKGAATTNSIKQARRMAFEDEKFERAVEVMFARDEARRARRRQRYEREKATQPAARSDQELARDLAAARARNRARGLAYGPDLSGYGIPGYEE